jgi:hypothetical protein
MKKDNPFRKYLTEEDLLQEAVMKYIALEYPWVFAYHTTNEGRRTAFERYKFKVLGGCAGIPDIHIPSKNLWIELKTKKGKLEDTQKETIVKLRESGQTVEVCFGFDQAKAVIDKYLDV